MTHAVRRIVVVGGGTAGWLTACMLAARADPDARVPLSVTLVESPDIPTIGVGEGTWPTMRRTLETIGISETEFLVACDASFKQGSRFDGWRTGAADDRYHHPFTPPAAVDPRQLVAAWEADPLRAFATTVGPQPTIASLDLAPRQPTMPDYAGALNYAYHLDAGKLATLLARHGQRLGVRHLRDRMIDVVMAADGDIAAIDTRINGRIDGDLFVDCTGHAALMIGDRYGVAWVDRSGELFNDRALAVQVPVAGNSPIAAQTNATAHAAGWIWDIGLPTRRGVGCVYSSSHASDDAAAATLRAYLARAAPGVDPATLCFRQLSFRSGHRARFWDRNCIAIGLSAGFLEPLEASAIVMIELSLTALIDHFPTTRGAMDIRARRFNDLFRYRWDRIVEFLKLHYVLSARTDPYWRDHREAATIPARLADLIALWRDQPPSADDFGAIDEVFAAASYQYVLYGMGFPAPRASPIRARGGGDRGAQQLREVDRRTRALAASLPTNRAYLDALRGADRAVALERY